MAIKEPDHYVHEGLNWEFHPITNYGGEVPTANTMIARNPVARNWVGYDGTQGTSTECDYYHEVDTTYYTGWEGNPAYMGRWFIWDSIRGGTHYENIPHDTTTCDTITMNCDSFIMIMKPRITFDGHDCNGWILTLYDRTSGRGGQMAEYGSTSSYIATGHPRIWWLDLSKDFITTSSTRYHPPFDHHDLTISTRVRWYDVNYIIPIVKYHLMSRDEMEANTYPYCPRRHNFLRLTDNGYGFLSKQLIAGVKSAWKNDDIATYYDYRKVNGVNSFLKVKQSIDSYQMQIKGIEMTDASNPDPTDLTQIINNMDYPEHMYMNRWNSGEIRRVSVDSYSIVRSGDVWQQYSAFARRKAAYAMYEITLQMANRII